MPYPAHEQFRSDRCYHFSPPTAAAVRRRNNQAPGRPAANLRTLQRIGGYRVLAPFQPSPVPSRPNGGERLTRCPPQGKAEGAQSAGQRRSTRKGRTETGPAAPSPATAGPAPALPCPALPGSAGSSERRGGTGTTGPAESPGQGQPGAGARLCRRISSFSFS